MYATATTAYELSDSGEYFLNVEDIDETPETIKAYIPKLMPNINIGEDAVDNLKITANPSIFVNATDCAVCGVSSILTAQNYITLKPYGNQYPNFRAKAELQDGKYVVKKHNKFVLEVLHGDIGNMYFTGKV